MNIVIPLYPGFTALDAIGPYDVLTRIPGATVTFAAERAGEIRTDTETLGVIADAAVADIDSCDVVVVPGGNGSRAHMGGSPLTEWIARVHPTTTWTTSVCTGALLLGAAGLLTDTRATTHWAAADLLTPFGATYSAERVITTGKIVTAAGVAAGIDMALTLTALLTDDMIASAIQLGIEYDPQPPFDCGSVAKASPEIVDLVRATMMANEEV